MNDVLSKYVEVAVEVLIFSLLIIVVALFSSLSKDAVRIHGEQQDIQREIRMEREFAFYINKGETENDLISGEDVIRFVGNFKHEVDIDINVGIQTIKLEKYIQKPDGTSNWDIELLIELMGNHKFAMYKIEVLRDEFTDEVIKVKFIKQ